MHRILILILFILLTVPLSTGAQSHDYNWLSGHHDFENLGNPKFGYNILTFSNTTKLNINTQKYMNSNYDTSIKISLTFRFNVFMSNSDGNLEWYSNGMRIFNKHHEIMENGDSINYGEAWETFNKLSVGYDWVDNQAIPLMPYDSNHYLMMHTLTSSEEKGFPVKLMYTLIDMESNNGEGKVLLKNKIIINDTIAYSEFVRHANGRDWWFVSAELNKDVWHTGLINDKGLDFANEIEFNANFAPESPANVMAISPSGEIVVRATQYWDMNGGYPWYVTLYHFDRCDGTLTLSDHFKFGNDSTFAVFPIISPNNRFVYFINTRYQEIYQCDLEAVDIEASCQRIAKPDGKWAPFPKTFFKTGLGPDQKIYIAEGSSAHQMTVINKPDLPGLACDVFQDLVLPCYNTHNVPRNPNYRLGPLPDGDACPTKFFTPGPAGVTVKISPQGQWRMYTDKAQVLPEDTLTFVLLEPDGTTIHCTKPFLKNQFSMALTDCQPHPGMEWYLYQDFATFARGIIE